MSWAKLITAPSVHCGCEYGRAPSSAYEPLARGSLQTRAQIHAATAASVFLAIVVVMWGHRETVGVLKAACALLGEAWVSDASRQAAVDASALLQIAATMCAHPADASVQREANVVLSGLIRVKSSDAVQAAVEAGVPQMVARMRAHSSNVTIGNIQEHACNALFAIVLESDVRSNRAAEAGVLPTLLVQAMRAHPGSELVQEYACATLDELLHNTFGASVDRAHRLEASMPERSHRSCVAMRAHPGNWVVQRAACALVSTIASLSEEGVRAAMRASRAATDSLRDACLPERDVAARTCWPICAAIDHSGGHARAPRQRDCKRMSCTLRSTHLSHEDARARAIMAAGALPLILAAMRANRTASE